MSVCTGIGNGLGGAIGKFGVKLAPALGLGVAVDFGVKAYTGYGLFETLSVPYIECADGSFATAMEWYGSGLQCPKRPPPGSSGTNSASSSAAAAAAGYAAEIEALGGDVYPYIGSHSIVPIDINNNPIGDSQVFPGHYQPTARGTDKIGNSLQSGYISEGNGFGDVRGSGGTLGVLRFINAGWGGWSSATEIAPNGFSYRNIRNDPESGKRFKEVSKVGKIIGLRVEIPELPRAPAAGPRGKPAGFSPLKPQKKPGCEEMACPCLTPADIELAVKKAIGVTPFAPEQLIRRLGAKMFAAPGPSLVPVVPANLVEAIAALVAANYMRAGYGRYPVLMPQSLINDNSAGDAVPAQPLENFAEWFEWLIKQQDAVQGEWPVELAIVDGAKRQPLRFENISEAFAELTGLMIQCATDADAAVAVGSHAAVAATKAQTAAIIAQKNAECIIKFFGIRTGFGSIFVQSAITPMDTDNPNFNLKKFLTPSQQSVAFYTDNDPFDFQAVLDRILRNSEIAKSAVAMDAKTGLVGDYARNQRKYDAAEAKREAEKELEKLQATITAQNPEFKVKIRVDTPAPTGDVSGDNFVIKRPKTTNE